MEDNLKYKANINTIVSDEEQDDLNEDEEEDEYDEEESQNEDRVERMEPADDESDIEEDMDEKEDDAEEEEESEEEEKDLSKQKFKAAKSNPVYYEDKMSKKAIRDEEFQKKKVGRSEYLDELRREMTDMPEEIHMGLKKKDKFIRELDELEALEAEHFKRKSFTKKEMKLIKKKEREYIDEKLDQLDDLNDIIKFSSQLGGKQGKEKESHFDSNQDVLKIPKEFLKSN